MTAAPIRFVAGLTADDVVARAMARVGKPIAYKLGAGGRDPSAPVAALDCSGHVAMALGIDRYAPGLIRGDWIWTDGMVDDATGPRALFDLVTGPVERGDVVVFRGRRSTITGRRIPGHCGIVVEPGATISDTRVSHCHGPTGRSPAVSVSSGSGWRKGIACRFRRAAVEAAVAALAR